MATLIANIPIDMLADEEQSSKPISVLKSIPTLIRFKQGQFITEYRGRFYSKGHGLEGVVNGIYQFRGSTTTLALYDIAKDLSRLAFVSFVSLMNGRDTIVGSRSVDRLAGGLGNDTYYVQNIRDQVVETVRGSGVDTVYSSVSFVLGEAVEHLILTGRSRINGTGNKDNNTLIGNAAPNVLTGGNGHDTLTGGGGRDVLSGGSGRNTFVIRSLAEAGDTVTDFDNWGNRLVLSSPNFGNVTGRLPSSMFALDEAVNSDTRFIFNRRNDWLSYDADGTGPLAAAPVVRLPSASLRAGDIILTAT